MNHKRKLLTLLAALGLLFLLATAVLSAPGALFDAGFWTVDGGGGNATGGPYTLSGTIAQPDAGPLLAGGGFEISGGYWGTAAPATRKIFLPTVMVSGS